MTRFLRAWFLLLSVFLTLSSTARAEMIHVCVRPPDVPPDVGQWAYGSHGQTILKTEEEFRAQAKGLTVYVLDRAAPPESVGLLPARHHGLKCPGAKAGAAKPPPAASATQAAQPKPPAGGTASAPAGASTPAGASRPAGAQGSGGSGGTGTGQKKGEPKTATDKLASELAYGAAIASGQLNENDKRPDGKKYGVIGGNNPNGPNNPLAQAAAGALVIVASVLSVDTFETLLKEAVKKKVRLFFTEKTFSKATLDLLLKSKRAKFFADALAGNGAIGPYSVMSQFTQKLGGQWQAHHILEKQMFEKFTFGNAALAPSVILTDAEHKAITATLATETARAKTKNELWKGYQKAYGQKHPHWLDAIKPYFFKKK